jgi:hypothetical protein
MTRGFPIRGNSCNSWAIFLIYFRVMDQPVAALVIIDPGIIVDELVQDAGFFKVFPEEV